MDIYKVNWTRLQAEIFRALCIKAGNSMNLRGLAGIVKKTPTAILNVLPKLKAEGIIIIEKSRKMNLLSIELNRDNPKTICFKRIENLKMVYESGIIDYLKEKFQGSTIIIFGSYSKGEDTTESDIDIAVIGSKEKAIDLAMFDKIFERKVTINFYKSFKEIHKHLLDNILNGILLNGGVEL